VKKDKKIINITCPFCFHDFRDKKIKRNYICPKCNVGFNNIGKIYTVNIHKQGKQGKYYPDNDNGSWDNIIKLIEERSK
jgi:hypothetical protein